MEEEAKPWFCYMLRCRDGAYYIGIATDVEERVKEHNWGVGAKFTSKRRPVTLVWSEKHSDQGSARQREREVKGWSRAKKERLTGAQRIGSDPSGSEALRVNPGRGARDSGE